MDEKEQGLTLKCHGATDANADAGHGAGAGAGTNAQAGPGVLSLAGHLRVDDEEEEEKTEPQPQPLLSSILSKAHPILFDSEIHRLWSRVPIDSPTDVAIDELESLSVGLGPLGSGPGQTKRRKRRSDTATDAHTAAATTIDSGLGYLLGGAGDIPYLFLDDSRSVTEILALASLREESEVREDEPMACVDPKLIEGPFPDSQMVPVNWQDQGHVEETQTTSTTSGSKPPSITSDSQRYSELFQDPEDESTRPLDMTVLDKYLGLDVDDRLPVLSYEEAGFGPLVYPLITNEEIGEMVRNVRDARMKSTHPAKPTPTVTRSGRKVKLTAQAKVDERERYERELKAFNRRKSSMGDIGIKREEEEESDVGPTRTHPHPHVGGLGKVLYNHNRPESPEGRQVGFSTETATVPSDSDSTQISPPIPKRLREVPPNRRKRKRKLVDQESQNVGPVSDRNISDSLDVKLGTGRPNPNSTNLGDTREVNHTLSSTSSFSEFIFRIPSISSAFRGGKRLRLDHDHNQELEGLESRTSGSGNFESISSHWASGSSNPQFHSRPSGRKAAIGTTDRRGGGNQKSVGSHEAMAAGTSSAVTLDEAVSMASSQPLDREFESCIGNPNTTSDSISSGSSRATVPKRPREREAQAQVPPRNMSKSKSRRANRKRDTELRPQPVESHAHSVGSSSFFGGTRPLAPAFELLAPATELDTDTLKSHRSGGGPTWSLSHGGKDSEFVLSVLGGEGARRSVDDHSVSNGSEQVGDTLRGKKRKFEEWEL